MNLICLFTLAPARARLLVSGQRSTAAATAAAAAVPSAYSSSVAKAVAGRKGCFSRATAAAFTAVPSPFFATARSPSESRRTAAAAAAACRARERARISGRAAACRAAGEAASGRAATGSVEGRRAAGRGAGGEAPATAAQLYSAAVQTTSLTAAVPGKVTGSWPFRAGSNRLAAASYCLSRGGKITTPYRGRSFESNGNNSCSVTLSSVASRKQQHLPLLRQCQVNHVPHRRQQQQLLLLSEPWQLMLQQFFSLSHSSLLQEPAAVLSSLVTRPCCASQQGQQLLRQEQQLVLSSQSHQQQQQCLCRQQQQQEEQQQEQQQRASLFRWQPSPLSLQPQQSSTVPSCSARARFFASSPSSSSSSSSLEQERNLAAEPFLTGTSAAYVEQMYAAWRRDPAAVHASWAAYFSNVQRGLPPAAAFSFPPPSSPSGGAAAAASASAGKVASSTQGLWCPYVASAPGSLPAGSSFVSPDVVGGGAAASPQSVQDTSRLIQMVRGYQLRGHECAAVNPLELPHTLPFVSVPRSHTAAGAAKLDYTTYGFTAADLDRVFDCRVPGMEGFLSAERSPQTLRQLVHRLEEAYCGSIGVEYMHINDREVCNFIRKHIETPEKYSFPAAMQQKILARTARAQLFENFCGQRFSTSKRFGLDGCETMIVGLKALTKKAAREGVKSVVIGMPHRGRLNVLVNILHKPMQQLLSEFLGVTKYSLAEWGNSGDVKYHLGVEFDHFDADAQRYIHMGVLPNPSHLEAVDPLVIGQARAQQYYSGDRDCSTVLPVLLHGDASIAGQGVVYETLQMSQLPFYRVGGAIHIVVNNQIGFTTNPVDSCSGRYCTDVAKAFDAPVFHVNADDPEAVTFVSELAFKYRQHFKGDVFIDLVGYRRLGHNELDMPKFTQPAMYTLIAQKKPVFDLYAEKLRQQGVAQEADLQRLKENITTFYNAEYEKCKTYLPTQNYEYSPQWKHLVRPDIAAAPRLTGVPIDRLRELGTRLYTLPQNFSVHPTVGKIFKERLKAIHANVDEKVIDFGTAETLCYASLLSDGFHVRVAGQDVQRGTFSHRHAVLHDQTTFEPYCIYSSLRSYSFPHEIIFANSLLSEYAAMGYEFGYSLEHPDSLCIWEAQFGDFSNGAQIIIDQFVASGEVKWNKQSGIVLMLPHGYDGQGPEHSSGRIERLLQLCDDREDVIHRENWEIERSSVIQQHNLQVSYTEVLHILLSKRCSNRGF